MNSSLSPWIRKVTSLIPELQVIPLFGHAPSFPLVKFSRLLSSVLQQEVEIELGEQKHKTTEELKKELGAYPFQAAIDIHPLSSCVFLTLPRSDIDELTSLLLNAKGKGKLSKAVQEGFLRYVLLEVLGVTSQIEPFSSFSFHTKEEDELPEGPLFCIQFQLLSNGKPFWGQLLIPNAFREQWIAFFSRRVKERPLHRLDPSLKLPLSIKIGQTRLTQEEWSSFEPGDFLVLDKHSWHLVDQKTYGTLMLYQHPLLKVKIQHKTAELLKDSLTPEDFMDPKDKQDSVAQELVSIKDLPLSITVEISRFSMSLENLLQLTPGNEISLSTYPSEGVLLTVEGKTIGRGELIQLGETLGVRILEIGS